MAPRAWHADAIAQVAEDIRPILEECAAAQTTITYKELGQRLSPPRFQRDPNLRSALTLISKEADHRRQGLLTVLVVLAKTRLPSEGFFEVAACTGRNVADHHACFERERRRVYREHASR